MQLFDKNYLLDLEGQYYKVCTWIWFKWYIFTSDLQSNLQNFTKFKLA